MGPILIAVFITEIVILFKHVIISIIIISSWCGGLSQINIP